MLQEYQQLKISEYQNLYDRLIPESHVLRKFNNLMDFSFVRDELEHKYCLNNGRNAISPVMLFKYLILKAYYTMSDADLVERSKYDMSFKYFLGLRPEDDVIHSSTLTKFRKLRLADENILDLLIEKTVAIAIEKGIIKEKCIIVDATHTKARYNQKSAYQALGDHGLDFIDKSGRFGGGEVHFPVAGDHGSSFAVHNDSTFFLLCSGSLRLFRRLTPYVPIAAAQAAASTGLC